MTNSTAAARAAVDREIFEIHGLLEPAYGHVNVYGHPYAGRLTGTVPGPYPFEIQILPALDQLAEAVTPRQVRELLQRHAEDALDALAAAGWQLTSYPRMEFTGVVQPFDQTPAGDLSQQSGIALVLRFEVNRPRGSKA